MTGTKAVTQGEQGEPAPRGAARALFLDRDGVLNLDHGYVGRIADFAWTEGAREAVRAAHQAGWLVFVVTNQSGIARGYYTEPAFRALMDWMTGQIADAGGRIDDWRHCPHHPQAELAAYRRACPCRKPQPGMLNDLIASWRLNPRQCVMIGDQDSDAAAAAAAGVGFVRFTGGDLRQAVATAMAMVADPP